MNTTSDHDYYRMRATQKRERERLSERPEIARVHRDLAVLSEERAASNQRATLHIV